MYSEMVVLAFVVFEQRYVAKESYLYWPIHKMLLIPSLTMDSHASHNQYKPFQGL